MRLRIFEERHEVFRNVVVDNRRRMPEVMISIGTHISGSGIFRFNRWSIITNKIIDLQCFGLLIGEGLRRVEGTDGFEHCRVQIEESQVYSLLGILSCDVLGKCSDLLKSHCQMIRNNYSYRIWIWTSTYCINLSNGDRERILDQLSIFGEFQPRSTAQIRKIHQHDRGKRKTICLQKHFYRFMEILDDSCCVAFPREKINKPSNLENNNCIWKSCSC